MFNIVARKTLLDYAVKFPEASDALFKLYHELKQSNFKNMNEIKKSYSSASIIADNRVVFNIKGNTYRLVLRVNFEYKSMLIKWFGTHKEYDKINVEKVKFKKK